MEYYEPDRMFRNGDYIAEDEKIVNFLPFPVVARKTICHLTPYDKIGIIGGYIRRERCISYL